MSWEWRMIPCFASLPDPVHEIKSSDFTMPLVLLSEKLLTETLWGLGIEIYALLCFTAEPNGKRIAAENIIEKLMKMGVLKRGCTIVVPTSGNFGVAIAFCAKKYGIKVIALVADSKPRGKLLALERAGSSIIRESEAVKALGLSTSLGSVQLAEAYAKKIGAVCVDQYSSKFNVEGWSVIAEKVSKFLGGAPSMYAAGAGSVGSFCGFGKHFRSINPATELLMIVPFPGQHIEGLRPLTSIHKEIKHPWEELHPVIEEVDEKLARSVSDDLDTYNIPGGWSSGAVIAGIDHHLLNIAGGKYANKTLDQMRGPDGKIKVFTTFVDTRYPYG